MTDSFIPLVSDEVIATTRAVKPFEPVGTSGSAHLSQGDHSSPTLSFKRDGDRITEITVQCSCGRTIELACEY